jgi:hypothetical protein
VKARRKLTAEQEAKRDARKSQFRELWKRVGAMPELERIQLANKCGIANCEGHVLSIKNQCLIALQLPSASVVGGFRQWLKQGRAVMKGQHGAMIWIKAGQRPSDDNAEASEEGTECRFITGTVFDIGQTMPIDESRECREAVMENAGFITP